MSPDLDRNSDLDEQVRNLFSAEPAALADPFPIWNRLRNEAPIYPLDNAYILSTNSAIKTIINDRRATHTMYRTGKRAAAARAALSAEARVAFDEVSAFEQLYMSRSDGDAHDRLRRIAQRTFTPRRIRQIEQIIESTARDYIDELAREPVADFMQFAYKLPLKIIGDLLGLPDDDLENVHLWSNRLGENRGGTNEAALMAAHSAMGEFRAYVEGMIEDLRCRPITEDGVSLVADLLDANRGETLSDAELTAMFVVLLFAGHETTTNLIGSGLLALLQNDAWKALCAKPELIPQAVDELVRFVTPVQWVGRSISEAMEVDCLKLEEGDSVILALAAANRDPKIFLNPDVLNIHRGNAHFHLGFGFGSHFCLGTHLARMEAITAFSILADKFPSARVATDAFVWKGTAKLRGLATLPVKLTQSTPDAPV